MKVYFAVVNRAEHSGFIASENKEDAWTPSNPNGWTFQGVAGPHGAAIEFNSREEAEEFLNNYLKCDAAEKGRYCYSHNRYR